MVSLLKGDQARTYATLLARRAWCWKRRVFQIRVGEDTAASHCLFSKNLSISCQHCVMLLGQTFPSKEIHFVLKVALGTNGLLLLQLERETWELLNT